MPNKPVELLSKLLGFMLPVVIVFIIGVVLTKSCNQDNLVPGVQTFTKRDTVYIKKDSFIYAKPTLISTDPDTEYISVFIPDTNYDQLVLQYDSLKKEYLKLRVYGDVLYIDSMGSLVVKDTVSKNHLVGRSYTYQFKYPVVRETTTVVPVPKPEYYFGGMLNSQGIHAGFIYKDVTNRQFGATVGIGTNGKLIYGIQSYWKFK